MTARRLPFRVIEGGRNLHRIPVVPVERDGKFASGIAVGMLLSVPCWWALYSAVWWARATGLVR